MLLYWSATYCAKWLALHHNISSTCKYELIHLQRHNTARIWPSFLSPKIWCIIACKRNPAKLSSWADLVSITYCEPKEHPSRRNILRHSDFISFLVEHRIKEIVGRVHEDGNHCGCIEILWATVVNSNNCDSIVELLKWTSKHIEIYR